MRDTSTALDTAITNADGIKPMVRATCYKNRNYFSGSDINTSNAASFAQTPGIKDEPLSQDVTYSDNAEKIITVYAYSSGSPIQGTLYMQQMGYAPVQLSYSGSNLYADSDCRPAIITSGSNIYAYYYDPVNDQVRKATVAVSGSGFSVSAVSTVKATTYKTAVHAVGVDDLVLLWIYEGGVKASTIAYSGSWTETVWGYRFVYPTHVYTEAEDAVGMNFSGAVKVDNDYYVYYTKPDGSVAGVIMYADGLWSDTWEALPSDLSTFKIAKAIISPNGYVHLSGQFQRIDEGSDENDPVQYDGSWSSSVVMGLDLWSREGRTFSLDRYTLFTADDTDEATDQSGYRFMLSFNSTNHITYYSDANRYYSSTSCWSAEGENAQSLLIDAEDIRSFSGEANSGWSFDVANGDELYTSGSNLNLLKSGNVVTLEVGATSGSNVLYTDFDTCIIAATDYDIADAKRSLSVSAASLTLWKTSVMTHPFYLEIQSKQSVYDDMSDLGNMYEVGDTGKIPQTFWCDFWNKTAFEPKNHPASATTVHLTDELSTLGLADNPVIETLPLTVKLFGWSRSGDPSYDLPYGDDASTAPNDDFTAVFVVVHPGETEETTIVIDNVASGSSNPPQTWGITRGGSYPVIHIASGSDGLQIGDEVVKVGFRVTATSEDETVYVCERMEIPELTMFIPTYDDVWNASEEVRREAFPVFTFDTGIPGWSKEMDFYVYTKVMWDKPATNLSFSWDSGVGRTAPGSLEITQYGVYPGGDQSGEAMLKYTFPEPRIVFAGETFTAYAKLSSAYMAEGFILRLFYSDDSYDEYYYHNDSYGTGWRTHTLVIPSGSNGKVAVEVHVGIHIFGWDGWYDSFWNMDDINVIADEKIIAPSGQELLKFGSPSILFSRTPFWAFNFQTWANVRVVGTGAKAGVVGLAADGHNYVAARATGTLVELVKVRAGIETVLASQSISTIDGVTATIMMEHKDGAIRVWVRTATTWSETPTITYQWTEADGTLCVSKDIIHVGAYGLKDAPVFRTVGFDSKYSDVIGVLPGDSEFDSFPSTGTVAIDGMNYSYDGKMTSGSVLGPYQCRNTQIGWNYTSIDGQSYSGNAIEFTRFEWAYNPDNHNRYDGKVMAASNGHAWIINDTDFKAWTKTAGQIIYLKNRGRFFGATVDGNFVGWNEKIYITHGLTGVELLGEQEPRRHGEGSFCWLRTDCQVFIVDYYASNGFEDVSVEDIIDTVCQMAGGEAEFPGDTVSGSRLLTGTEWTVQ